MTTAPIAPNDVLMAFGLHAPASEPHAQHGNHIRVTSHPLLGLPVAPLMFWRAEISPKDIGQFRDDVTYFDRDDQVMTAPPQVSPGQPVRVEFPTAPGETCIWAQVFVDTDRLDVEVFIESANGPVGAGVRSDFPYGIGGPGITHLEVRSRAGTHVITGVAWLELSTLPKLGYGEWTMTNLPHPEADRYLQVDGWETEVRDRVELQAPQRVPLQDESGRPAPAAATLVPPQFELDRVDSLTDQARVEDLPVLLNDLSQRQIDMVDTAPVEDHTGKRLDEKADVDQATVDSERLSRLLAGTLDPGVASMYGFKAFQPALDQFRLVVYFVEAIFEDFNLSISPFGEVPVDELAFASRLASVGPGTDAGGGAQVASRVDAFLSALTPPRSLTGPTLRPFTSHLRLGTWCVIDERAPLNQPSPPRIEDAEHVRWVPVPPPDALRETRLDVSGIEIGGLLAVDRGTGGAGDRLNASNEDGFHLPIVLGLDSEDGDESALNEPGRGFITDPQVAAPPMNYGIAQQDRFGRWSGWASGVVPTAARPRPPIPVFQAYYEQPDPDVSPMPDGEIRVIAQIPAPASLAPAALPVVTLRVEATDLTTSTTDVTLHVIANPTSIGDGETLDVQLDAPSLSRTEQRTMQISARWLDTDDVNGEESGQQLLELVDPRPPSQPTVPNTLQYTGRPDVTGLAWAEHTWTPGTGQAKSMVYYADEGRVRSMLERGGRTAFLADLDTAGDAPARAGVYRTRAAELTDAYFERLDGVVTELDDGDLTFRHAVSGSLAGLSLYRIGSESSVGATTPLADLPVLVFGVPNTDPPAPPIVDVKQDGELTVNVSIKWEPGPTPVHRYRLRRSRAVSDNPLRMPEVLTAELTSEQIDAASVEVPDTGPVVIASGASLRPWTLYSWVAELQGAPEPGSVVPVAGRWSRPSAPFGMVLTPPDPPAGVLNATATGTAAPDGFSDVAVSFEHPTDFDGGAVGSYRLVVIRRPSDGAALRIGEFDLSGSGPHKIVLPVSDPVAGDTAHTLTIVDPLGRPSVPVDITTVTD